MRIFTRYILREVTSYALLGGVLFTFVLFMRDLGKILELVVRNSASLTDVLRIFAYTLPNTLTVTIPTAVLAGILLGLSRLAADSEITAMRSCGIGATAIVRIVSIVATAALALGLVNALYFAPSAARDLLALEGSLKSSQASFEVQPRVFYEGFRNDVLYVQDVRPAAGAAVWRHVFLADVTQPASPHLTTADEAIVTNSSAGPSSIDAPSLRLHLIDGGEHHIAATDPNQYDISTFTSMDLPIQPDAQDDTHLSRSDTPLHALPLAELYRRARNSSPAAAAEARNARIEFNIRFSYPFACLVLMLIGVPLGLSSKRGGKSTGFVLTLMLVFVYYFLSNIGVAFAKSGKLSPLLGVWGANILFAAFGSLLLQQMTGGGVILELLTTVSAKIGRMISAITPRPLAALFARITSGTADAPENAAAPARATLIQRTRRLFRTSFPLLLDEYVMRQYAANFALALLSFAMLFLVFTFFELIGPVIRNRTPLVTVGDYLINLIPFIINAVTPLCSLLAVLITFGALSRSSELTAMKATGISLYRVVAPILVLAAIIAAGLFAFDESYLPDANRRQEALLSEIKGKPSQTFLQPDRKWISGQTDKAGDPSRIFYYQFFDPDRNVFANLTVFEFDPRTFSLQRRIFATSARWEPRFNRWIFDNGWQRTFAGETIASYQPFTVNTFPEIREPPTYFKKEDLQSQQMSYGQLSRYISDLRQSGFDTVRLSVQLARKIADPITTLVMAILAVPFALSMGKRGGLAGIATAIFLAMAYWVAEGIFGAMGNVNTLPPLLAAWTPDLLFGIAGAYLLLRTQT
jgi:LPS export ABC transporter permease LptG/LPS export ABC transporter permease LptF